jgi:predicted O-linked N-acetylglucosamine transferase (SPINDLY family)
MGIPFITLADRPSVGRIGCVVLKGVGHPEWIAYSEEEYVEKAVKLANNLEILAQYRATLRGEIEAGEICNKSSFVSKLEKAYQQMWQHWCSNNT